MAEVLIKTGTAIVLANITEHSPAAGSNLGTRTNQIDLDGLTAGAYRQSEKFASPFLSYSRLGFAVAVCVSSF